MSAAFLSAEDVNIIVVDWSAGAGDINYANAVANTITGGKNNTKLAMSSTSTVQTRH
jgi:hypothetical protein